MKSAELSLRTQRILLAIILLLGLLLRLKGISHPLLDHPGWRQGDEAAIARNFAFIDLNPLHPQADYNGPGTHYVELELQIVPWLTALLYKLVGVHEYIGRLLSVAASLGTIALLNVFGRYLFSSASAGLAAALLFAIAPGSIYYGRTFQPDTTMTLLLTAALYTGTRLFLEAKPSWRRLANATFCLLGAVLAKSVAILALVPLAALSISRYGWRGTFTRRQNWILLLGALVPFLAYDRYEASIASWKWASGITKLHVIPGLVAAATSPTAFLAKWSAFTATFTMLAHTMLGPVLFGLLILACIRPTPSRSPILLWWWLIADLLYAYAVVTVERVDYYLYPFIPLAALLAGGYLASNLNLARLREAAPRQQRWIAAGLLGALLVTIIEARQEIAAYYDYNPSILREAHLLNRILPAEGLVVLGHLDPSVLYYIHRRGWQEDPYLWTPFDEQSAIRKGALTFIAAEPARLKHNVELNAWLQRFPLLPTPAHTWLVYRTDPSLELPGAEQQWRSFRQQEASHKLEQHKD